MAYIGEKNQSGFNEKVVANRTPIIELDGVANLSELRDDIQTEGTGTVNDNASEYLLKHNDTGDFAKLTSSGRGRYVPGNVSQIGCGVRLSSLPSNGDIECKWGYFQMKLDSSGNTTTDIGDGFLFGEDTSGTFVEVIKSGASLTGKVYKNSWNLNSSVYLNLTEGNIFQISYTYYGYGLIKFQLVDSLQSEEQQKVVDLHSVRITGETSLNNSNLKVGGFVRSTNSSDQLAMYVAGRQYSTIGPFKPNIRFTSEGSFGNGVGTTNFTPLVSFRRKSGQRETPISLYGYDIIADQNLELDIRVNGNLTNASFTDVTNQLSGETTVEVDTSATAINPDTGVNILKALAFGGSKNNAQDYVQVDNLPLSFPDNGIVTISARALSTASENVNVIFKVKEEY